MNVNSTQFDGPHPVFFLDPKYSFFNADAISNSGKPFVIPIVGLIVGAVMMQFPKVNTVGKLVLYFGAQSFMNIYMGWVMRTNVTVAAGNFTFQGRNVTLTEDLTGCPAGFALTAFQQVVSFIVFMIFFSAAYYTPYKYVPKTLNTTCEMVTVVIFGCVFALNIALNNFSLGYINIAVNLIIRSCLPLSTNLSQRLLAIWDLYPKKPFAPLEFILMVIGVLCAGVFTMAKIMSEKEQKESSNMVLGVTACIASLFCGSLNLALAGVLGETKLNVYDTVAYMAIPATVFLAPIAYFVSKQVPGKWSVVFAQEKMTDFEILMGTWELNKTTMAWLLLSGIFSFAYNIIQFSIVHTLSPSATAFGGNFNKAALIFLTLLLPFLRTHELPGPPYIYEIWIAVIINIASFSAYSYLQIKAKQEAAAATSKQREFVEAHAPQEDDSESDSEEDDDDDDTESSEGGKLC
uniref:Sugar phosphate transporter domain-containing protein n=1 Tax=Alexandrium monilatum TaxID=311494 RepID=A0A7S4UEQ2_9DINO|mmetsp:Transcript_63992/g.198175  ORF Transcript_63992/g.198175 Transcript_63992/m.198175 type:complete len:462 (+) Transcript_63992:96-1481(+)